MMMLVFFIYSVAGWMIEVVLKYQQFGRFINRGFLIGPYCPIYGAGGTVITLVAGFVSLYDDSPVAIFLVSMIVSGALEYFVSFYMEKRFHARWWDYSQKPMNLNGRIWIGNLILFGIAGIVIVRVIGPFMMDIFSNLSSVEIIGLGVLTFTIMASDFIGTYFVMKLIRIQYKGTKSDDTEEIGDQIRELLRNKSMLHRRILEAYPNAVFDGESLKNRIKEKRDEIRKEAEKILEEIQRELEQIEK